MTASKPPPSRAPVAPAPAGTPPHGPPSARGLPLLQLPGLHQLRQVRDVLSAGPRLSMVLRKPEDHGRICALDVVRALIGFLEAYRQRVQAGSCRIVPVPHPVIAGRLHVEFHIVDDGVDPASLVARP